MSPWLVLVAFISAINLAAFTALRGRWDRLLPALALAAVVGTVAGNAIGQRNGLELFRIGDFSVVAASVLAQLAMLAVSLLAHLGPSPPGERVTSGRADRDGSEPDR
jgi:ABC-type transport system involved in cytochrome c biogenesis permease subunit